MPYFVSDSPVTLPDLDAGHEPVTARELREKISLRRILCPIDFSCFSETALRYAGAVARWYGAELVALHVFAAQTGFEAFPTLVAPAPLESPDRERLMEALIEFVEPLDRSFVKVRATIAEGDVVAKILESAARLDSDLIVLGTHGRSGFERLVLGSVTEKILRKSPVPVLTVPPALAGPESGAIGFEAILCPVDFSPVSRMALRHAASLAVESRSRLVVLHALETLAETADQAGLRRESAPETRRDVERARQMLHVVAAHEASLLLTPEEVVASGKAYRAILAAAKERGTGLIVMGVHGRSAIDLALFGSTTSHVVREAACPVLTIREKARNKG